MRTRTLVITGATGFVGTHLARIAASAGWRVVAVGRDSEPTSELSRVCDDYVGHDLTTSWPIPAGTADATVHLAGLAAVGRSFSQPQEYIQANSAMMTHMGEAMTSDAAPGRLIVVSSGAVYAPPLGDVKIDEEHAVEPTSPYAVAKILVETQARYYARRGLDVVVMRPFNHIGPGQGPGFLVPDLTAALATLPDGDTLEVGNLSSARDYTDVRDVAAAYLSVATAGSHRHGLYNVASGRSLTGQRILDLIADALDRPVPTLRVDPDRLRPDDPPAITGSAERIRREFGWHPTITPEESIRDFVDALER